MFYFLYFILCLNVEVDFFWFGQFFSVFFCFQVNCVIA